MITGVAFVPCAPVLVSPLAAGAAPELDDLRNRVGYAVTAATSDAARVALVGPAPASAMFDRTAWGTLAGYGADIDAALDAAARAGDPTLPPALTVAAWLTQQHGCRIDAAFAVGPSGLGDGRLREWCADGGALVVAGDGSARRSTTAPGYLDPRAEQYDRGCADALGSGDPAALTAIDAALGEALLAAGPHVWNAVAGALDGCRYEATLDYDEAPYGVGYFVAHWARR